MNEHIYSKSIFMRLGKNPANKFDGDRTMKTYTDFCTVNDSVWFSTDSLSSGMSKIKIKEFLDAIRNGYIVEMYFAIGNGGGGNNDMKYKAQVLDIRSSNIKKSSPDPLLTPVEWVNDLRYIWIKIQNIQPASLRTHDFVVISTGNVLANATEKSQYHFGYIQKI